MLNKVTYSSLEFNRIIEDVKLRAMGDFSKEKIQHMQPATNVDQVRVMQQETQEARLIIDSGQHVPFMGLIQINQLMKMVQKGLILKPQELLEFADFLRSNRMIQKFFEKNKYQTPLLYKYSRSLENFIEIEELIYTKISGQKIADEASRTLRKARRQLDELKNEVQDKLNKFIKSSNYQTMLQERMIVNKNGSYTIPIKASYKNKIPGTIIDQSNNGQTFFIEPTSINRINEKINLVMSEIEAEEYQILAELTGLISEHERSILNNIDAMTMFDIIFARGKYSREYDGITPIINKNEKINLIKGRHPFLPKNAVPLDFKLGYDYRGLVITGANAGGKTVTLKTVGLLTLMAMFGLQIPAQVGSEVAVFDDIFVDIGDQQDLDNALSTFSGHMQNVSNILKHVGRNTLVLLDEIGSGTEPNEGAGLAIAILEAMYQRGALLVATTHYGEIKHFAEQHPDLIPAAMQFDQDTLTPKYILQIGQVGDSQALWIAKKMQMPADLIKKASQYINGDKYNLDKKEFKEARNDIRGINETAKATGRVSYQKGDRVVVNESGMEGLVYLDEGQEQVKVYVDGNMQDVYRKRIKLKQSAHDLYPANYDLESLFVEFHELKKKRDLERGSKKALKALHKEAQKRRQAKL